MHTSDWKNTKLWKQIRQLESDQAEHARTLLNACMPDIQRLLAQGGTAPLEFTLHDSGHSYRVAERMVDLIPSASFSGLSAYEHALLLLSAYLHDIGMTPTRRKVSSHYQFLMTGDVDGLASGEASQFQAWLDDYRDGISPPLITTEVTTDALETAEDIITHYCRYRHNDWSEEWIRENLATQKLGTYKDWADDLIALCRSHHYGYQELIKHRFDPRIVGIGGDIVHLRYLATVLRIADVLEFDPERTPEVIFQHRDVRSSSKIFWWKDHDINFVLEDNRVVIYARPENAYIHKAIQDTIDQVNDELRTCRILADETHFNICPGLDRELPHKWKLRGVVHDKVEPYEGTYEYINGAFRPDTEKLLELLSGSQLYGSPLAAVRELIQNAFDAVREQIAYVRLAQTDPSEKIHENTLGDQNHVTLKIEENGDEVWLICTDSGVGMTKRLITDYLLVSGKGVRHEVLDLERLCENAGFQLGRTGQFGIGVLSYFMLAKKVIIYTLRSQDSGQMGETGWRFETSGIGSFGELRKDTTHTRGTEVRLLLRPDIIGGNLESWGNALSEYIRKTLVRVPCTFEFTTHPYDSEQKSIATGWCLKAKDITDLIIKSYARRSEEVSARGELPYELLPLEQRMARDAENAQWDEIRTELKTAIRWKTREGALPDGAGKYRIHSCYFELPRGRSTVFLRVSDQEGALRMKKVGTGYSLLPAGMEIMAWKGMKANIDFGYSSGTDFSRSDIYQRIRARGERLKGTILEVDIQSRKLGMISVNRSLMQIDSAGEEILNFAIDAAMQFTKEIISDQNSNVYASLNSLINNSPAPENSLYYWIAVSEDNDALWRPIVFPVISSFTFSYSKLPTGTFKWKGKPVMIASCLGGEMDDNHYTGIAWNSKNLAPSRIVQLPGLKSELTPLWEKACDENAIKHPLGLCAKFPPAWRHLVGANFIEHRGSLGTVWNIDNPLVNSINSESWGWCQRAMSENADPLYYENQILSEQALAASWVAYSLLKEWRGVWKGLSERDPNFLPEVFRLLFGAKQNKQTTVENNIYFWVEESYQSRLWTLNPSEWTILRAWRENRDELRNIMPDPGSNWRLEYQPLEEDDGEYAYDAYTKFHYESLLAKSTGKAVRKKAASKKAASKKAASKKAAPKKAAPKKAS